MGITTLVEDINRFLSKNLTANHFIPLVQRQSDVSTQIKPEKLRFFTYGSPKLRYMLHKVHTYVLPCNSTDQPRKLLVTEDLPLTAFSLEMVLKSVYVNTKVIDAALSDVVFKPERQQRTLR